jgi:hypothetical protein
MGVSLLGDHQLGQNDILPVIALSVSLTALFFIVQNYWRKSGTYVRGQFCVTSSAYAEEEYVSSITIENVKDRPVIIFKIYLLIGRNYYLLLNDFDHEPKILKPYETYTDHYSPVDFYSVNMNRIKLTEMLGSNKVKSRIVLTRKYRVKS